MSYDDNSTQTTLENNSIHKHKIKVNTLDNLIKKKYKPSLTTFVKIDVEGMEADVLEGMKTFIDKYKPDICLEINPNLWTKILGQQYKKSFLLDHWFSVQFHPEACARQGAE